MFIDRMLNQGNTPLLERTIQFAATRHRLIAENIVNATTPGYRQKDLSLEKFQSTLRERVAQRSDSADSSVSFNDVQPEVENRSEGILYHDGNNRSMEQLQSDLAKNAMMHNMAVELLRKQFQSLEMALRERIA